MKTITFHNSTKLDPMSFKVMGLSVKDDNSIGMFGTGLKYAIAVILRAGDKLEIRSHGDIFKFGTVKQTFRGEDVELVTCNGEELGFTTQLGKTWETWMAYRELYCNALDEGGNVARGIAPAETQIIVRGEHIARVHEERGKYFLMEQTPIWKNETLEIYEGGSNQLFFQGVAVGAMPWGNKAGLTYNLLTGVSLTEDRTAKYSYVENMNVAAEAAKCTDKALLRRILADKLDYERAKDPSNEFVDLVEEEYKRNRKLPNGFKAKFQELRGEALQPEKLELSERQEKQIRKAKEVLAKAGYNIDQPIFLIESKGDSLYGQAKEGEIWLTSKAFEHGQFDLCATLLEEYAHNEHNYNDFTREFQDWLFRQVMVQIEERLDIIL